MNEENSAKTPAFVDAEIASQPTAWNRAIALAPGFAEVLPQPGERVAVVGCGTSWFIAMSYARLREQAGHGETDAFAGSEYPAGRSYDRIVAITRSGTTSEIITLLAAVAGTPTTVLTAVAGSPVTGQATHVVLLDFADEQSVVQTRFATTALTLLRAHEGVVPATLAADAERALEIDVADYVDADQLTFLGSGWTLGLADEAALKAREASQSWAEAYPAMDYRHGPIAIAEPGRIVWLFGDEPAGLADDIAVTGATYVRHGDLDPQASLIIAQRLAVARARDRGLDPDHPRHLTRSVILGQGR